MMTEGLRLCHQKAVYCCKGEDGPCLCSGWWNRTWGHVNNLHLPFQVPFSATMSPVRLHSSNPNLCADTEFQTPPSHLTDPLESSTDYTKLQEEFCLIAQKGNTARGFLGPWRTGWKVVVLWHPGWLLGHRAVSDIYSTTRCHFHFITLK